MLLSCNSQFPPWTCLQWLWSTESFQPIWGWTSFRRGSTRVLNLLLNVCCCCCCCIRKLFLITPSVLHEETKILHFSLESELSVLYYRDSFRRNITLTHNLIIKGDDWNLRRSVGLQGCNMKLQLCFFKSVGERSERMWRQTASTASRFLNTDVYFPPSTDSTVRAFN